MHKHRQQSRIILQGLHRRFAEDHTLNFAEHSCNGKRDQQDRCGSWIVLNHRGQNHELAGKNAERWHPENRQGTQHQTPANRRRPPYQPLNVIDDLGTGHLRCVTDSEEYCYLTQRMNRHIQQSRKTGEGSADTKSEGNLPHVLD